VVKSWSQRLQPHIWVFYPRKECPLPDDKPDQGFIPETTCPKRRRSPQDLQDLLIATEIYGVTGSWTEKAHPLKKSDARKRRAKSIPLAQKPHRQKSQEHQLADRRSKMKAALFTAGRAKSLRAPAFIYTTDGKDRARKKKKHNKLKGRRTSPESARGNIIFGPVTWEEPEEKTSFPDWRKKERL